MAAVLSEKREGKGKGEKEKVGEEGGREKRRREEEEREKERFSQDDLCTNASQYSDCICNYNRHDLWYICCIYLNVPINSYETTSKLFITLKWESMYLPKLS